MASPGLGEALLEDLVVTIEEDQADRDRRVDAGEAADQRRQPLGFEGAGAAVEADREIALQPVLEPHEPLDQRDRQIVDGLEALVLEDLQAARAPGTGHAGHDDEAALGCRVSLRRAQKTRSPVASSRSRATADAGNGSRSKAGRVTPARAT